MAASLDSVTISAAETTEDVGAVGGGHLTSGASTRTAAASPIHPLALGLKPSESAKLPPISLHKVCRLRYDSHAFDINL